MSLKTSLAYRIIQDLYLKNRNFCSNDYDICLHYLSQILPFQIHSYTQPYNQWEIHPKWDLIRADISLNGQIIYEVDHPLKIIGISKAFVGEVSKKELQKHLHYDHRFPDAIPYHFRQFYRPWEREWGFCVPRHFYNSLQEGQYSVHIETKESEGSLQVAEYTVEGEHPECFAFVAHLDHPGMANDDLAGVAVGVELFKKLSNLKTKFSYKLILLPEIIGSEFYLGQNVPDKNLFLGACFLEMLGSKTQLGLQYSCHQDSKIESCLAAHLKKYKKEFRTGPFKSIICNDEAVWQSHQIPMCSLSRFPYPEYHSSLDNISIIDQSALNESVDLLMDTITSLDALTLIEKNFTGTPCVSNPNLSLYIDPGQRAFGSHKNSEIQKQRLLMDLLPSQKRFFYLEELSKQTGLSQEEVLKQLRLWESKNLLTIK